MANRWYVKLGDEELGPLSDSGLNRLIEAGGIQGDTLVRSGPGAPWTPVQAVPGLMAKLARPATTSGCSAPTSPPKPPAPRPAAPPTVVMLPAAAMPHAAARSVGKLELGLGAAACLIAFAAAWIAAHLASSHGAAPAVESSAAAGQLAALKHETDLLQQELSSARRQLDDLRRAPPQPRPSPPPSPPPPPVDLAAERKALGEAIARDWAAQEDAAARLRYELTHVIDPAVDAVAGEPYKSQADELFRRKLPEVERELAAADQGQLAQRKQELQRQQSESREKAGQLLADAKAAIKRCDLERADELLKQYLGSGFAERRDEAFTMLKEMKDAAPEVIAKAIWGLTASQRSDVNSTGRLPDAWPHKYTDPDLAEVARQFAVRVARFAIGTIELPEFDKRSRSEEHAFELSKFRKLYFAAFVAALDLDRNMTQDAVSNAVDAIGFFSTADLMPQIDGVITGRLCDVLQQDLEANFARVARGEIEFVSIGDLVRKCREMAGEKWPADDAPLPYAGHWASRDRWHLYIDPWRDAIVYRKSSSGPAFEQRICKLAPGYLVAYDRQSAGKLEPRSSPATNPFHHERFDVNKDESSGLETEADDKRVALTLYVFKPGEPNSLHLYRRYKDATRSVKNDELLSLEFWKSLGDESLYRSVPSVYRFVDDKQTPE